MEKYCWLYVFMYVRVLIWSLNLLNEVLRGWLALISKTRNMVVQN